MTINAESLRNLVIENRWEEKRLSATAGQLCPNDYKELTDLYKAALDALTDWAAIDYSHAPADGKDDAAFTAVKNILALYDNGDTRIIIDRQSMRTMRDCATKPKRLYSDEYKDAKKALSKAKDSLADRMKDAESHNIPMPNADESMDDYVARVRESGIDTKDGAIDLLDLLVASVGTLNLKKRDIDAIVERGHYSWRRPVAVPLNEFADLIENYIGDCLEDGYNIKTSATIREEKKAADKAKRDAKKNA